jgi:hypothetical protein
MRVEKRSIEGQGEGGRHGSSMVRDITSFELGSYLDHFKVIVEKLLDISY